MFLTCMVSTTHSAAHSLPFVHVAISKFSRPYDTCYVSAERDPDYQKTALERLDKNQKVILMCSIGGTIKTGTQPWGNPDNPSRKSQKKFDDPERAFGRESRSLKACHELFKVCFEQVAVQALHLSAEVNHICSAGINATLSFVF